jgi:hypothetical protein
VENKQDLSCEALFIAILCQQSIYFQVVIKVLAPGQEEEPNTAQGQAESEMIQECSEVSERGSDKLKFVEQSYLHFLKLPL